MTSVTGSVGPNLELRVPTVPLTLLQGPWGVCFNSFFPSEDGETCSH